MRRVLRFDPQTGLLYLRKS